MAKWHFFSSKLPWTSPTCSPLCGEDRRACWCSSALHWCWARERCSHIQVKATSFCQRATGRKNQALTSFEHLLLLLISLVMVALIQRSYWLVEWSNVHNNKTSSETFAKANKDERFALCLTPPNHIFCTNWAWCNVIWKIWIGYSAECWCLPFGSLLKMRHSWWKYACACPNFPIYCRRFSFNSILSLGFL